METEKYFIYNELESGGKKRVKRNSITLADAQCLLWWSVSYFRETWLLRFKPPKMVFPSLCCLFWAIYQKLNNMLWIYRREYLLSLRFLTARRKLRLRNSTKTRSNAIRNLAQRAFELRFFTQPAWALTQHDAAISYNTYSWSNTTSHNTPLREYTFTIIAVALTRHLYITYWRLRPSTTKPWLYIHVCQRNGKLC